MQQIETLGVIGDPVAHSLSPAMHEAALRALDYPDQYGRWHTPPAHLAERIAALRQPAMRGANVTLPHKIAVVPFIDQLNGVAQHLGAVNTLVRQPDSSIIGYNTDAPAFQQSLKNLGWPVGTAVVVGAGGAARAAVYALQALGCPTIHVLNRTLERAQQLLTHADQYAWSLDAPEVPELLQSATLVVNATALGWHAADPLPLDPALLHNRLLVYDMVYRTTPLLQAAQASGAATCDGTDMLVRQAGLAFELWFHVPAPLSIMRQALETALRNIP